MKRHLLFCLLLSFAGSAFADTNVPAAKVSLYQSATNNPASASWYESGFDVGSYSKNYAMVTLLYFDLSSVTPTLNTAGKVVITVKLNSVESTPKNMNIDYLGTFADTTNSQAKYSAPSLGTFNNVLTKTATAGTYTLDVTQIPDNSVANRYAVFRLYQTGYLLGDSVSREYHFSSVLTDTRLITTTPSVVPGAVALPAIAVQWPSISGQTYQVQSSIDLSVWQNFGSPIPGDGSVKTVYEIIGQTAKRSYRVQSY